MESEFEKQILTRLTKLEQWMRQNVLLQKTVFSIEEAATYLNMKVTYLYKLTSKKLIPHSKGNGKLLSFKREELDEWRLKNHVSTQTETASEAGSLLRKNESRRNENRKKKE